MSYKSIGEREVLEFVRDELHGYNERYTNSFHVEPEFSEFCRGQVSAAEDILERLEGWIELRSLRRDAKKYLEKT